MYQVSFALTERKTALLPFDVCPFANVFIRHRIFLLLCFYLFARANSKCGERTLISIFQLHFFAVSLNTFVLLMHSRNRQLKIVQRQFRCFRRAEKKNQRRRVRLLKNIIQAIRFSKIQKKVMNTNPAAFMRNCFPLGMYVRFVQETNLKCRHIMDVYTLL